MAKIYFFKGDQYIQFDTATNRMDSGYPRSIADDWAGLKELNFHRDLDAVAEFEDGKIYLFKGQQYVVYDITSDTVAPGSPAPISGLFQGIPPEFYGDLDAVVKWDIYNGRTYIYLFKGSQYLLCYLESRSVAGGAGSIARDWPTLPAEFQQNLDTVVNYLNGTAYFFRGKDFNRYFIGPNSSDHGVAPIRSPGNWNGMGEGNDFASDLQAGVGSLRQKRIGSGTTGGQTGGTTGGQTGGQPGGQTGGSPQYNPNGTYRSTDGTFTLTITNSTPGGQFGGTYTAKGAPHGAQTFAVSGQWRYAGSKASPGTAHQAVAFVAVCSPEDATSWLYVIEDAWTGHLTPQGNLSLTGVRGYLDAQGAQQLHGLGTWDFNKTTG
jgi:hypothetical protein